MEAIDYIGLSNLRSVDWQYNTKSANIEVVGNKKGEIETICLMSFYEKDSIRMQTRATVYTDKYTGEMKTGLSRMEMLEFYDSYACTNQHVRYHVVGANKKENGTFKYVNDVYLVLDNILYRLNLVFEQEEMGQAQELIEEWANSLERPNSEQSALLDDTKEDVVNNKVFPTEPVYIFDAEYIEMIEETNFKEWIENCDDIKKASYFEEYSKEGLQMVPKRGDQDGTVSPAV